ncbi:MAG: hypothetical protein Q9170_004759 [Blastenia crenularia]
MSNAFHTTSVLPSAISTVSREFVPYFDIGWGWLALPILAIIATLALLIFAIVQSVHYGIPAWKSGQLASLLALSGDIKDKFGDLGTNAEVEKRLAENKETMVRLSGANGHWSLLQDEEPASTTIR